MKRSAGVTVIAVLSLIGSLLTLFMGLLMTILSIFLPKVAPKDPSFSPQVFRATFLLAALVYILPAVWGIVTSIGLFRLKEWARISMIAFSVLLIVMSSFGGLIGMLMPLPRDPAHPVDPAFLTGMRIFMGAFSLALLSLGIWWLVFLNRHKVKEQFVAPVPVPAWPPPPAMDPAAIASAIGNIPVVPQRPLSLTILAWFLLAGCMFIPVNLALHSPAIFLTRVLTGWEATAYFLAFIPLHLYVGIGLLRLQPAARTMGVVYCVLLFVNAAVFYLAPGGRTRVADLLQRSQKSNPLVPAWPSQAFSTMDITPFFLMGAVAGLIGLLVPLYFLITRKEAFEKAAAAAVGH